MLKGLDETINIPKKMQYRSEIDGLRAIAVLVIIFYHAKISVFSGGFVGVDIFFVISGYLITSIIKTDIEKRRFSVARFYERRVRRIFPALYPVLLFVLFIGGFLYQHKPFDQITQSIAATAVFSSNILFWKKSADYFIMPSEQMPLLHTWSLAVEEQFYIVYPLLLFMVYKYFKRKYVPWLLALILSSFVLSVYLLKENKVAAFYFAPSRAWELIVGSVIVYVDSFKVNSEKVRNIISVIGLGLIFYSVFVYGEKTAFPGYGAICPVLGTSLVIFSAHSGTSFVSKMLGVRLLAFIGLISYSLYLWHWPLFVFSRYYLMRNLEIYEAVMIIVIAFVFAVLSWKYIEQPFRGDAPLITQRMVLFRTSAMVMGLTVLIAIWVHVNDGVPSRFADNHTIYAVESDSLWSPAKWRKWKGGGNNFSDNVRNIKLGNINREPVFLLWGDSHAYAISEAISNMSSVYDEAGIFFGSPGAPPVVRANNSNIGYTVSDYNHIISYVKSHPEIRYVLLSASWCGYKSNDLCRLKKTVDDLLRENVEVILVSDVPHLESNIPSAVIMAYRTNRVIDEVLHKSLKDALATRSGYLEQNRIVNELFKEIANNTKVSILYPDKMLLQSDGTYRVFKDDKLLYIDSEHLSSAGAQFIAPVFEALFQGVQARSENSRRIFERFN